MLRIGIGSSPEWKEAWERINDYLDALRTPDTIDRELILLSSFERAIVRKRSQPFTPATELAFEEAQKTLDYALRHLIDEGVSEDRRSVEQRVRLYLTENADGNFLGRTEEMSEEVRQALREVRLTGGAKSASSEYHGSSAGIFVAWKKAYRTCGKAFSSGFESNCRLGHRVGNFRAPGFGQPLRMVIFPQPIILSRTNNGWLSKTSEVGKSEF